MCVNTVEQNLSGLKGMQSVTVNLSSESAEVIFNTEQLSLADIADSIEDSGYQFYGRQEDITVEYEDALLRSEMHDRLARAFFSLAISVPLMVIMWMPRLHPHQWWILPLSTILPFIWVSWPILKKAAMALKNLSLNMEVMYSLGMCISYAASLAGSAGLLQTHRFMYYDTAFMLAGFLMLGKYLELNARAGTSNAIRKLRALNPTVATVIRNNKEEEVKIEDIHIGELVVLRPGSAIPADGFVFSGEGYVDEAMLTGESVPVLKQCGSALTAGTINGDDRLTMQVERTGSETLLSQVIEQVEQARFAKAPVQNIADRAVVWFIPVVLSIALVTFGIWYFVLGISLSDAIAHMVSVMVVACPCALGLATPTAITAGLGRAASFGILFRSGQAVENAAHINAIAFDKTGTLTFGKLSVFDIETFDVSKSELLQICTGLEMASTHPMARAICTYAIAQGIVASEVRKVTNYSGKGMVGKTNDNIILAGNRLLLKEFNVEIASEIELRAQTHEKAGRSLVFVAVNKQLIGFVALSDILRTEAPEVVRELQEKYKLSVLSGDNPLAVADAAKQAGISTFAASLLPADKARYLESLKKKGYKTLFVGDGINDAPSLAVADLGVAMGSGTDIARESGDVVLLRNNLHNVIYTLRFAKKILARIHLNLFWAFAYNAILIPLATGFVQLPHFTFGPALAGLAMALSSVTVVGLSLLLTRYSPNK
jgi:Cu+-exporting ATPase